LLGAWWGKGWIWMQFIERDFHSKGWILLEKEHHGTSIQCKVPFIFSCGKKTCSVRAGESKFPWL